MFDLDEKGYFYTTIEQEINNKYGTDFHKNSVEKILKNTIYRGYKIYKGKKYKVVEPIVKDNKETEVKSKRIVVKERKRSLKKHTYLFEKFLRDKFTVTTAKKNNKRTGKIKYYPYYLSKENKDLKINENKILNCLISLKDNLINLESQKNKAYYDRAKKLFILGHIKEKELEEYKKYIDKNIDKFNIIDMIEELVIDTLGVLKVKFKNFEQEQSIVII